PLVPRLSNFLGRETTMCLQPVAICLAVLAATQPENAHRASDAISAATLSGLRARSLGPAVTSGRIVGFAVHPTDRGHYYVASASGGVWKTINDGISWTPIFDEQGSYSIGCVALDPRDPHVVWVGTGENNSQRSVGY